MKKLCAMVLLAGMPLLAGEGPRNQVAVTEWDNVLPQIADGNGWSTRIMLVNMGTVVASFTLYFYNEDGTAWNISLKGSATGPSATWSGTIPVGGSLFLETPGTGSAVTQGWAYLSTRDWISGMAVFKAAWLPTNDAEAVVPFASEVDVDFFIPFDNRNGYVTSIALVNSWSTATANVQVQFRNPDGSVIRSDTIQLAPKQHMAFETTTKYPETQGKNGVIEFLEPSGQVAASGMGLLFSPRNTFTSMHSISIDPYLY
jgi:hypothetical protein